MQKPLYIIGYMGAGKSTLSKVLSRVLNCENHDLDDIISSSVGKTINEIFDSEGEIVFRKIENEQLHLTSKLSGVISVGGGTPCYYNNIEWMNLHGITIYLRAKIPTLVSRITKEKAFLRPIFKGVSEQNLPDFIGKHLFERQFYYEQAQISCNVENIGWQDELISKIVGLN
ncbi:MAG: Shikimate kinase [Owenweeksia sp. TMED14]|nr:MAG: Shikimate kinase [Owenweeksia sp. TMED14]